jgi:RNA polymerase sigma factor (sigma-70 family)
MNAAGRQPLLTPAEELHLGALVRAWQDHEDGPAAAPVTIRRRGIRARNRFVSANLRLVVNVAQKYGGAACLEDRLQAGTVGLIRGAEKFDPTRGYKFSTYAFTWIRQSLIDANTFAKYPVKIPDNIAPHLLGWKCPATQALKDMSERWREPALSINHSYLEEDSDATLDNVLADPNNPSLDDYAKLGEMQAALNAMEALDDEVAALLELKAQGYKPAEIASLAGVHQVTLRSVFKDALVTMRELPEVVAALGNTYQNQSSEAA